ncbi:MAG TPA: hypothetical protein ENG16_01580 [Archaeoglobus sp.]|nr:hypothetical protein [Archaeoglobus sp.]
MILYSYYTLKSLYDGTVGWGWFTIMDCDPEGDQLELGEWYIDSANSTLPAVVGNCEVSITRDKHGHGKIVRVPRDGLVILRTNARDDAEYEIIGLLLYNDAFLLEVRRSERGIKAIEEIEKIITHSYDR